MYLWRILCRIQYDLLEVNSGMQQMTVTKQSTRDMVDLRVSVVLPQFTYEALSLS